MPGVAAHRRARGLLRLMGLCGVASWALLACGEDQPPATAVRGAYRLPLGPDGPPSLSTLRPDLDESLDVLLLPGQGHLTELALVPGRQYTVELHFSGARPSLRDAALDADTATVESPTFTRTAPLPGGTEPGVEHRVLRPTTERLLLEISAVGGETRLQHLRVRPWGASGQMDPGAATGWGALGVYGDHRVATVVQPAEELHWDAVVPAGATSLVFDVVPDPGRPSEEPAPEGVELRVEVNTAEGPPARGAVVVPIRPSRTAWQPVRLDLDGPLAVESGQRIRLTLRSHGADGMRAPSGVAVSAPRWHCTDGPRRLNLVLVSLDTTRPDHLGVHGYARDTSPNLDALALRSAVFEAAQSTAPYTLPSHASMFSGQYPTTHGAEHPAHALDPERTPLLAALLSDAGYATRAFTGGGYLDGDFGFTHGFDAYSNNDPVVPLGGQAVLDIQVTEAGRRYVEARKAQHWDAALGWIDRNQDVPFFLFIQTFAIHDYRPDAGHRELFGGPPAGEGVATPLRKPADQLERPYSAQEIAQLVDLYDGAIHEVDALIGKLVERLEELGLAEHTIVVVTADHGEDFAEHQVQGTPFVGHGQGLWQTLLHVPLVVHVPWLAPRRITQRVSLVDLAPTLLDLAEVSAPPAMQGRSLRALLETGSGPVSPVVSELHSNRGSMRTLIADDLKVVTGDPDALVSWPVPRAVQLFDLGTDPVERTDVGSVQRVTADGLSATLRAFAEALEEQRAAGPTEAGLSEETRRRLEELGYVDG